MLLLIEKIKSLEKVFKLAILSILIVLLILISFGTYKFITFDFQHEYREGAVISLAKYTDFNKWYTSDQGPENLYVYGFVFPFATKLLPLENKLIAGRTVTLLSILASGLVLVFLAWKKPLKALNDIIILLSIGVIFLARELNASNGAFPTALGQFLYIMAIVSPLFRRNKKFLLLSAVFGILAFYTKPYYALSLPITAMSIFFFDSKRRAVTLFNIATPIFLFSILLINWYWPGYFTRTFFSHIGYSVPHSNEHLVNQLLYFIRKEAFLLCALVFVLFKVLYKGGVRLDFKQFENPLINLKENEILYFSLPILITVFFFVFSMGSHVGATGAYYLYHLTFPFILLIVVFSYFRYEKFKMVLMVLLLARVVFIGLDIHFFDKLNDIQKHNEKVVGFLNDFDKVLNTGDLASILYQEGKKVYDNGQSEYFNDSKNFALNDYNNIIKLNSAYVKDIQIKIKNAEFDLIILNPDFGPFKLLSIDNVNENYRHLGQISIKSYYPSFKHDIWVQKEKYPSVEIPKVLR